MGFSKLIDRIFLAQKSKGQNLQGLVDDFKPLINKYASLLHYEDSKADIQLDFIELISSFRVTTFSPNDDPYVLAYLEKSIKNYYIRRSKKEQSNRNHIFYTSDLTDSQKDYVEKMTVYIQQL